MTMEYKYSSIEVSTDAYERRHGKKPHGRGYWVFQIQTDRATEKDKTFNSLPNELYHHALERACELAERRRAQRVVLMP